MSHRSMAHGPRSATYDPAVAGDLTIEQLAARSGMTVRNIRAHQARGLLAPPEVRLRVGYYGSDHVAQLQLIRELQDDGFNLAGIKRLLSDRERTERRLARFRDTLSLPVDAETPATFTLDELRGRLRLTPGEADEALARARRLGVLVAAGPDRFVAPRPTLLDIAEEVIAGGISLAGALEVFEEAQRHADAVATAFVRRFSADVWRPFQDAGMPIERWPEINAAISRLDRVARTVVSAGFGQALARRIEAAFDPERALGRATEQGSER